MKTIRLTLALILIACITISRAQGTWSQKAYFGGVERSNAVGFSIGDKGYIGTGSDQSDFWEYDPLSDSWTQKADFGGGNRSSAVGFAIGSKGYVGTGYGSSDFWEFDPVANTWLQKADFAGGGRDNAIGFCIGNKGYLGTGINWDEDWWGLSDFWEYDPATNLWTKKASFGGGGRYNAVGFSIGNMGYVGMGYYYSVSKGDFWQYNPVTDQWINKASLDYRYRAIGFSIGDKGYCGLGFDQEGFNELFDFNEYDPLTNSWTELAAYEGAGSIDAVGFSIGNKGYIGTGINPNGWTGTSDFWEYSLENCGNGLTVFADADNDSYGDAANSLTVADCVVPSGYVENNTDCDDANSEINPGASEVFNGLDDNCNGIIDDIVCNAPTSLETKDLTATSVKFKWDYSGNSYKLRYKVATSGTWTLLGPTGQTKTVEGLLANTKYVWQVKSVCNVDPKITSEWSAKQFFTTALLKTSEVVTTSFELYPNPVSQSFTLHVQMGATANPSATIYLLNALGQIIYSSQEITGNGELKKTITMPSTASSGWYIVRVVMSDQVMEQKLLYQK